MSKMTRIFSKEVIGRTMLLPIALLSLITSCSSLSDDEGTYIHVSVEPLRYVTEAIAGNRFIVHTLTPDGSSPETYQPTPQQIAELGESRMYIRVGSLGFERSLLRKFTCNMPHLHCVEASLGIDTLINHHRSGDNADYADPHTWTSPDGMRIIAANIYAALCRVDTAYRDTYARNFKTLLKRIDRVDRAVHNRLDTLTKRTFLTYHPALTYFARDYGLRQLAIEADGKAPSAEHLAALVDTCRRDGVSVVFVQKEFSDRAARTIAEETGARTYVINPLSYDWETETVNIAKALCHEE